MPPEHHVVAGIGSGLVYTAIPKAACTSINQALTATVRNHPRARSWRGLRLPREARTYFGFTFVRNPFDRLVSCYANKVLGVDQNGGGRYFESRYNNWLIKNMVGSSFHQSMSFDAFVSLVSRIPDWLADSHFRSQISLLESSRGARRDYVGRFETIDQDWKYLSERFGLAPLQSYNASEREEWETYYTDERTVRNLWQRYQSDIIAFGYRDHYLRLLQRFDASP